MSVRIAWERRGSGTPLVLVHGLGYARWGWEPVVDALAERFELILFDNRGVGESDVPPGPYTAGDMAGDVVQVMDEAAVERAHVLGTSLGGMIAQELALTRPAPPIRGSRVVDRRHVTSRPPRGAAPERGCRAAAGAGWRAHPARRRRRR